MTIADQQISRLDRSRTSGARTIVASTALAVALLCAQYASDGAVANHDISLSGTAETNSQLQSLTIGEIDVAKQISRVYEELLRNQKEIDAETRAALYANLADLYA